MPRFAETHTEKGNNSYSQIDEIEDEICRLLEKGNSSYSQIDEIEDEICRLLGHGNKNEYLPDVRETDRYEHDGSFIASPDFSVNEDSTGYDSDRQRPEFDSEMKAIEKDQIFIRTQTSKFDQESFCLVIRDVYPFKDLHLFKGYAAFLVSFHCEEEKASALQRLLITQRINPQLHLNIDIHISTPRKVESTSSTGISDWYTPISKSSLSVKSDSIHNDIQVPGFSNEDKSNDLNQIIIKREMLLAMKRHIPESLEENNSNLVDCKFPEEKNQKEVNKTNDQNNTSTETNNNNNNNNNTTPLRTTGTTTTTGTPPHYSAMINTSMGYNNNNNIIPHGSSSSVRGALYQKTNGMQSMTTDQARRIEALIEIRNNARRLGNFIEADQVRNYLRARGIALMDEPGRRGKGSQVTHWRPWTN